MLLNAQNFEGYVQTILGYVNHLEKEQGLKNLLIKYNQNLLIFRLYYLGSSVGINKITKVKHESNAFARNQHFY